MLHCLLQLCHRWEPVRCLVVLSARTAVHLERQCSKAVSLCTQPESDIMLTGL